ncbi:MAG: right-handed parallel beta-helix repeat-containing protein [Thermoplasmatota archaeon]
MKKMITIFVVAFLSISISTIDFSDLDIGTPDHQDVLSCDTEKNINSILKKDMLNDIKSGYTLRGPIRIDNNTDLSQEAVFNGWNGTGTESDPYIIEGYSIDGGGYGNCLYIGNTTDHFLIRDCHFYNATGKGSFQYFYDSCIYFYNATNGSVKDTNASHSWTSGIYHQYSHRITIDNLTVYYPNQMGQTGIYYFLSENNTVLNSTIISGGYGIKVTSSSDNNVIDNNHIMDVQWNGINIVNSENNTILNNTVEGIYNGMYLWDRSCYNTVYNNDVITNDYGIHVKDNSDYNKIYRNNLINNSVQGADDGTNQWDNGYPYGGNYWGDYSGSDDYCGVNQDISGGDGIGDTAYSIADGSGSDDYPLMKPIKDGRLQRPPFRINSNSDFDAAHGVTDGSGTEGDPWIIEKYHVAGNGVGYCFYVGNTTDHFILRDCILKNASSNPDVYHWNSMIAMYNTQNAMISDNELSSFMTGSSVTADFGIYMNTSDNNRFGDNNISKNENGVYLEYSGYNEFHGCQIFSNERYGMELYSSNNNTIDNTSIHSNDMHGIVIDASDHNKIKNNHIYGNDWAMYIKNSKYNTVSDNNVTGQERYGIHTWGAIENTIKDNLASDNGYHNIYLVGGQDNNVINNTVTKSDNGIYVSSSNRNLIDDNTAHSNHKSGVYIKDSQVNTVTNNSMQGEGIILDGAWQYHWDIIS